MPRHPIAATLSAIFNCQKALSPEILLFMVTKRPSSPRIGRIWVSDAWFGGVGRGGTTMTTGSGGGGGGGGGLGAQEATLARSPTTMILLDEFIMLSPAAATIGSNHERSTRTRPVSTTRKITERP